MQINLQVERMAIVVTGHFKTTINQEARPDIHYVRQNDAVCLLTRNNVGKAWQS